MVPVKVTSLAGVPTDAHAVAGAWGAPHAGDVHVVVALADGDAVVTRLQAAGHPVERALHWFMRNGQAHKHNRQARAWLMSLNLHI